jgi:hypothetical protein
MPDLTHRLRNHDLGFLRVIALLWGVDLDQPDARSALPVLNRSLQDPALVQEVVEALPEAARKALDSLVEHEGWLPWSRFTREFGALREVGPGRRDREKPFLDPISATETLWYRGLIGRDFLQRGGDLQECAYIPDEFLELLPPVKPAGPQPLGRAASPGETHFEIPVNDRILDHTCTLLAALRLGSPERSPGVETWQPPQPVVHALLAAMKLITSSEQPVAEDARPFLEMSRGEALTWLFQGWWHTERFDDLRLMPGIVCEGAWQNDPLAARIKVLEFVSDVPGETWWNLDSFVRAIHQKNPDFQRPAGDYDSWLIRDARTGKGLQGDRHWDAVDGAFVRYLITGPMHWLGLLDLAAPGEGQPVTAFRWSAWSEALMLAQPVMALPEEEGLVEVTSDGKLIVPRLTPRLVRYQISRFGLWPEESEDAYTYQLTPASLDEAAAQGLKAAHLESLLAKHARNTPPSLIDAVRQWEKKGGQVRIEQAVILRVDSPKIMQALRESTAARFVGDPLGPTAAVIHPGAVGKIRSALARLGYLSDIEFDLGEELDVEEPDV